MRTASCSSFGYSDSSFDSRTSDVATCLGSRGRLFKLSVFSVNTSPPTVTTISANQSLRTRRNSAMTWFIAAHPTLLAIGLLSVYTFLFSSGVISPICLLWSKFKARTSTSAFNSSRFAHNVYVPLMILSFISCLGLSAAFGAAVFLEQRTGSSQQKVDFFFCVRTFWSLMKYWERFPKFAPDVFTFCIMYCFACADVLVPVLVVLVTARHWPNENMKAPPQEITSVAPAQEPGSKNVHGFIVVAHNSSADIIHTIRAILKHVEPWQLFIADNGNILVEIFLVDSCVSSHVLFTYLFPRTSSGILSRIIARRVRRHKSCLHSSNARVHRSVSTLLRTTNQHIPSGEGK